MDRRKTVLEIIEKNPGIRFNEIMRISNIRNGTLSHYVKKLEEEESIELERTPRVTRLYPAGCLLYTSPSPRDRTRSRMPSSA